MKEKRINTINDKFSWLKVIRVVPSKKYMGPRNGTLKSQIKQVRYTACTWYSDKPCIIKTNSHWIGLDHYLYS